MLSSGQAEFIDTGLYSNIYKSGVYKVLTERNIIYIYDILF
jgi:hypothetical protein